MYGVSHSVRVQVRGAVQVADRSGCGPGRHCGLVDVDDDAMSRSPPVPIRPLLLQLALLFLFVAVLVVGAAAALEHRDNHQPPDGKEPHRIRRSTMQSMERLARRWAPLVWLSPGERFMPAGVDDFLRHVTPLAGPTARAPRSNRAPRTPLDVIPQGPLSAAWYLVSNGSVDDLLRNSSSFLYGRDPSRSPVPVYAVVTLCDARESPEAMRKNRLQRPSRSFRGDIQDVLNDLDNEVGEVAGTPGLHMHVTYWMFFPYNEGKPVCVLDLGPLGPWPIPLMWGACLGSWKRFGAHVGDWEHISLLFSGQTHPDAMYVSAHEAGAFYRWAGGQFVLERQEVRRGPELLQRAAFPPTATLHVGTRRPELFAAQGSHGLWTQPGSHRYVRVPRLYDHSGYGAPWRTWERLAMLHEGQGANGKGDGAGWLRFLGRWGNPRADCHPLSSSICKQSDGPTGIPMKTRPFRCPAPRRRR